MYTRVREWESVLCVRISVSKRVRDRIAQVQYTSCDRMKCSTHKKHCVCAHSIDSLIRMARSPCLTKVTWRYQRFYIPDIFNPLFLLWSPTLYAISFNVPLFFLHFLTVTCLSVPFRNVSQSQIFLFMEYHIFITMFSVTERTHLKQLWKTCFLYRHRSIQSPSFRNFSWHTLRSCLAV